MAKIVVQEWNAAKPVVNKASSPSMEQILRDMSNEVTAKTFDFNSSEAQKARDFQLYMSDTSHQREVEDLKKAGLNPVLSANGGAASYSAASASGSADNSAVGVIASIYNQKMANENAVKIAQLNNKNSKEIAKINAAANMYASENSYAASRYATDHSKYGLIENFVDGILNGNNSKSSSGKVGSTVNNVLNWTLSKFRKK